MISLKLGNASIVLGRHIPNPLVVASYQGYHEVHKYFTEANDRITYLEKLLDERGIPYDRASKNILPEPSGSTT